MPKATETFRDLFAPAWGMLTLPRPLSARASDSGLRPSSSEPTSTIPRAGKRKLPMSTPPTSRAKIPSRPSSRASSAVSQGSASCGAARRPLRPGMAGQRRARRQEDPLRAEGLCRAEDGAHVERRADVLQEHGDGKHAGAGAVQAARPGNEQVPLGRLCLQGAEQVVADGVQARSSAGWSTPAATARAASRAELPAAGSSARRARRPAA